MDEREEKRQSLYGFDVREVDKRRSPKPYSPDIKQLWQRSHEILGLSLQGFNNVDIAKTLNISKVCVSQTLNSELGQKKMADLRDKRDGGYVDVAKKIAELSEKALKTYEEIFDSDTISQNLKKATADTVLMDLGGHRSPTKIDNRSVNVTASLEEIEEFKRIGHKAAEEAGYLIEIDGE